MCVYRAGRLRYGGWRWEEPRIRVKDTRTTTICLVAMTLSNHQSTGRELVFVLRRAVVARLFTLFLLFWNDLLLPDYIPHDVKLLSPPLRPPLSSLARWDSVWFLSIADKGYPTPHWVKECCARAPVYSKEYCARDEPAEDDLCKAAIAEIEQPYAFFPLYPWCIRFVRRLIGPVERAAHYTPWAIAGVIVSIVSFTVAACALHQLIKNIFHGRPNASKEAGFTVLAFCWNPAAVHFSVCYSESIFAALTFTAMAVLYAPKYRRLKFERFTGWISAFIFALASLARANGILNALFIAYSGFTRIVEECRRQNRSVAKTFGLLLETLLQTALVLAPMCWLQWSYYSTFCLRKNAESSVLHPWCFGSGSILSLGRPSLYSWIQAEYWDVGLFKAYKINQLPLFLLASPVVYISVRCLLYYLRALWNLFSSSLSYTSFLLELFLPDKTPRRIAALKSTSVWQHVPPLVTLLPFMIHWAFLLLVGVTIARVEVTTRLVASSCPLLHWFIGRTLSGDDGPRAKRLVKWWLASYTTIGSLLHSKFYAWT